MNYQPLELLVLLSALFALIAFLYASVGFGGGSSYTAVLAMAGMAASSIPVVSLSCNLIVATGGAIIFCRRGHMPWRRMWPVLLISAPAAYLAGRYRISPSMYFLLLGLALSAAAILLWRRESSWEEHELRPLPPAVGMGLGGGLGVLAGLTGIGGGIYLSPLLMLKRWALPKQAAAAAAVFIGINSLAGLLGQLTKPETRDAMDMVLPLGLSVLIGGFFGSRFGAGRLSPLSVRRGTALLVAIVAARILYLSCGMLYLK